MRKLPIPLLKIDKFLKWKNILYLLTRVRMIKSTSGLSG